MTEEQMKELTARLDDLAGMAIALMQVAGLLIAASPQKDVLRAALPKLDDALAGIQLNSQFSDRALDAAAATFGALTQALR